MTGLLFLLAEMGLVLLLAGIAGWYVGWSWRGFRERDRREDLHRTLRATEEVKERELSEALRHAASLESQMDQQARRIERLEQELAAAMRQVEVLGASPLSPGGVEPETTGENPPLAELGQLHERLAEAEARTDDESARRREAEAALREKTAATLAMQAELQALRQAAGERAADLARLEARVVELEAGEHPAPSIAAPEAVREAAQLRGELDEARVAMARLQRDLETVTADLDGRDRRINELRSRYQEALHELEQERARPEAGTPPVSAADREEVEELRRLLQRQVERNRKLEAVHRAVVANMQSELAAGGHGGQPSTATPSSAVAGNGAEDDLTRIHGIGPDLASRLADLGVTRFAQIASWGEEEIAWVSERLGDVQDRIRRDGWVEGAREQLRARYGDVPWR